MSRMMLCLCLAGCFSLSFTLASAADKPNTDKPNANRLTYLDEPSNPWYPHRDFPKLTTPMWVGEEGVEAVVILGIDDMRGHEKWEAYLRPILNRLKQIDGRAPVSIFTCSIDPKHPHLQQWLSEGLSLEVHTIDHPCPLLNSGDLAKAKSTVDRCTDLLNEVPNNKPVCFRMPCCDSLNTLSPRFYTEIFNKTTPLGRFLLADSSVMQVFTSDDPALPRELVLESLSGTALAAGESRDSASTPAASAVPLTRERFKKYLPADRFFTNYIENYPYPFVVDRMCWEFPTVLPSDWSAQHRHKPNNPVTIEDWKAALDCTVIKQGVFCLVFHPHNWIKPEQINELIDHAVTKHGKKIKFLNFREAVERLNKNVLGGKSLRKIGGASAGYRVADLDGDGFIDTLNAKLIPRYWKPDAANWKRDKELLLSLFDFEEPDSRYALTMAHDETNAGWGEVSKLLINSSKPERTTADFSHQIEFFTGTDSGSGIAGHGSSGPVLGGQPAKLLDLRFIDFDSRGDCEALLEFIHPADGTTRLASCDSSGLSVRVNYLPVPADSVRMGSTRFIDIDEDGDLDIVFSDHKRYGIWLWEGEYEGWSRELLSAKRGDKPANEELPPIVRVDGSNNGFWVHKRELVWMNEDTAKSKDLVERRSFDQLLASSRRSDNPVRPATQKSPDPEATKNKNDKNKTDRIVRPTEGDDPGPKSPEASLKMIQVKPGYRVELVAAEPLVRDPVAFDWGPDGKLWVAEMADYPLGVGAGEEADGEDSVVRRSASQTHDAERRATLLKQAGHTLGGGRVRFLEDTDGDGKYDKSTVFLDKLNFPNGVMAWRDGVLISAAPDVLFARDTNGDGRADEVKVLLTGFGEGNQQHRVNGFSWGLDNMVHCANGDSGGAIKVVSLVPTLRVGTPPRRSAPSESDETTSPADDRDAVRRNEFIGKVIDIRGRDFRWNPDTGELDPTSGQTQFGRNRDDFGNWFGNNNANPMYHFVLDDFYTRRNPHVAPPDPRKQVSITPGPSPVFPISRTLARFNDFAMANRFTSANSAMVYRDVLLVEGAGVGGQGSGKATDKTQNTDDSSSLGTPHSALPTPQHVFISEPVHNLVHHEVMTADGVTFTSRRADDEQQSEFLASRDNWFRPTQIKTGPDGALYIADMYRQVIEHPQYIPPALQEKLDLRAGHDKGRIYRVVPVAHAVRVQGSTHASRVRHKPTSNSKLLDLLSSPNGWQRDMAYRELLWQHSATGDEAVASLRKIVTDATSPLARLHAIALLDGFKAISLADAQRALSDSHPAVRRRALQAIENFDGDLPDPLINQLSQMGRDPDPFVRMQFAYTLGHPKFGSLGHELGKLLYRERDDKYLVAAAMSSIHAQNVASVVANVFKSAGKEPLPPQLASTLLGLASTLGNDQALLSLIESVLNGVVTTEAQSVMLAQVLEGLDRRGTSLNQLKGIAPERLARAEQQIAERIKIARTEISNLKSRISSLKAEDSDRVITSLPLLGRTPDDRAADAELIGSLLVPQVPATIQSAAIGALSRINHASSATALLSGWKMLTPGLRQQVLDALLSRVAWTDQLLDQIEAKTISTAEIDAVRRQRLVGHTNPAIKARAAKLLDVVTNPDRQKVVAEYAAKLKELKQPGDATRGAEVFKQRQCAACHKLRDIGTPVGPDLVALTDKSTAALLTAILDPNKAVEAKYLAYAAATKEGRIVVGMIVAETGNSITLAGPVGKPVTLLRADIEEFVASNKSYMPEGLELGLWLNVKEPVMTAESLADLIAFVQSSGPPPKKFDGNQPEAVIADASGTLKLLATNAEIYGKTLLFEPPFKNLGYWGSVDDRAVWTINVAKPGKHSIRMNYACDNGTAGNEVVIEVSGQSVTAKIVGTGAWENYQTAILGELNLPAGQHRLTVRSTESLKNHLMDLKELRLVPE
ncbi:MAG: PVC-type heme-binding CxxCH protein [Planctomycetaceae bacterium]